MSTVETLPPEEVYSQVAVKYRMKKSKRWHTIHQPVLPDPFAGLPGIVKKERTYKVHLKERYRNNNYPRKVAKVLASRLAANQMSANIGPIAWAYNDKTPGGAFYTPGTETKASAMSIKAGDKIRLCDLPGGTLSAAMNAVSLQVDVNETGGLGGTERTPGRDSYVQIGNEVISLEGATRTILNAPLNQIRYTLPGVGNRAQFGTAAAVHPLNAVVFTWQTLNILSTGSDPAQGTTINCGTQPVKLERWLRHHHHRHKRHHPHHRG